MLIYYYPVTTQAVTNPEDKKTRYKAVDWLYDKSAYMGFEIESLEFTWVDSSGTSYEKNVFKVEMVLSSPQYGLSLIHI